MSTNPNPPKAFWLFTQIILKLENSLAYLTGLGFALACVIFEVLLGMKTPNLIVCRVVRRSGETFHDKWKVGEIPPIKLQRSGTWDPIRVDISETRDEKHGIRVFGSGKYPLWNLFASPILQKIEIYTIHSRKFKYESGQEIRPEPPKSGNVSRLKITKFAMDEHRIDQGREGRDRIFNW